MTSSPSYAGGIGSKGAPVELSSSPSACKRKVGDEDGNTVGPGVGPREG